MTKRVKNAKVFAAKNKSTAYLKNPIGSRKPLLNQTDIQAYADGDIEAGFEAIKGDVSFNDVSNMFWYVTSLISHIYERGVPEFSAFENYPAGAVVSHDGKIWIAKQAIEASVVTKESAPDPCNCCQTTMEEVGYPHYPSKDMGWCYLVDSCEFSECIDKLKEADVNIIKMIKDLETIGSFKVETVEGVESLVITSEKGTKFPVAIEQIRKVILKQAIKDGSGLSVTPEGELKVKPSDFIDGNSLSVGKDGKVGLDGTWKTENIDTPINTAKTEAVKEANEHTDAKAVEVTKATDAKFQKLKEDGAEVFVGQGVSGNGTKVNPLTLKVAEADFGFNGNSELFLKPQIQDVTNKNLNTLADTPALRKLGLTTFYGKINRHGEGDKFTVGFPSAMTDGLVGTKEEVDAANIHAEYKDYNADFTGYQFASPTEVIQVVVDEYPSNEEGITKVAMYTRAYSAGMDAQGNLNPYEVDINSGIYNAGVWTKWQRVTALPLQGKLLQALNSQVQDLTNKVQGNSGNIAALQDELAKLKARLDVCCKDSTPAPEPSPDVPSNAIRDDWRNYPTGTYIIGLVKSSDILDFENGAKRVNSHSEVTMGNVRGFYDDVVNTYTIRPTRVLAATNSNPQPRRLTPVAPQDDYLLQYYTRLPNNEGKTFTVLLDQLKDREFTMTDPLYISERATVDTQQRYPNLVGFIAQPAININGENYNIVFTDKWLYKPKNTTTADTTPSPNYPAGLGGVYTDGGSVKSLNDSHNPPVIANPYLHATQYGIPNVIVDTKGAKIRFGERIRSWTGVFSLERASAFGRTWYRNPVAHTHTGWKPYDATS